MNLEDAPVWPDAPTEEIAIAVDAQEIDATTLLMRRADRVDALGPALQNESIPRGSLFLRSELVASSWREAGIGTT